MGNCAPVEDYRCQKRRAVLRALTKVLDISDYDRRASKHGHI